MTRLLTLLCILIIKIRGDYGATFRTGSIIIITFDSDVGSLSFSIWKDNSSSSSFSLDPLVQNIVSPRRSGQVGGTVEHWGIAFEGLPLDAKLYPAVGLYQRDDRVTLLSVESSGTSGGATGIAEVSGGDCFFPRPSLMFENVVVSERATKTRQFNSQLMWDGIRYTTEFLQFAVDSLRSDDDNAFLVENLLPSLASSLCLFPQSVPVLSARCALHICPNLSRTVLELQSVVDKHSRTRSLFYRGMREGRWTIRTSSSMSTRSKFDEYTVDFNTGKISGSYSAGFEGTGSGTIGKSKCGAVKIIGCLSGSSLSFIEDWTFNSTEDSISSSIGATSSSAILARISLNGDRFEGVYHNVQSGIAGHVVGILSKEKKNPTTGFDQIASTRACAALFCLAQSHLATILCDDTAGDIGREDISNMALPNDAMAKQRILKDVLTGPLFSRASLLSNNAAQGFQVAFIKEMYSDKETSTTVTKTIVPNLLSALDVIIDESIVKTPSGRVWTSKTYDQVCLFDDTIAPDCGGFGSLRSLSFTQYMETRRKVISSIIFHCYICDDFCKSGDVNSFSSAIRDELKLIWRTAVKIVESTVRKALSRPHTTASSCCVDACDLLSQTAAFLLDMQLNSDEVQLFTVEEVAREVSMIYVNVDHKNDLAFLEVQMSKATSMGLMRLLAFQESSRLLSSINVQNMELAELLINGFPRLLGRGRVDTTMTFKAEDSDDHWMESLPAISGSYLSQLSGIDLDVKGALRNQVSTLLALLGPFSKMAVLRCGATTCQDTSNDSLAITLISIFMGQFQQGDLDDAMMDSGILSLLECMFSVHRSALTSYSEISFVDEADGLTDLAEICKRDVSRVLLRSAIAASHVLTYQVSRDTRRVSSKPACLIRCLESLLTEFTVTSAQIEDLSLSTLSDNVRRRLDDEWQNWYSTQFADKGSERPAGLFRSMTRVACFCYFREHGTILNNGNAQPQKSTPSKSMPGSLRGSESRNKSSVVFSHQLLSHWLDVLCMVLRSRQVLSTIAKDKRWMIILFRVIGLTAEVDTKDSVVKMSLRPSDDGILPARFRARLIRLMLPFLSTFEPCEAMVEGLLYLAGATSALLTKSQDVEECFVSREAISLLRQLHSPRDSRWRETINISISTIAAGPSNDSSFFGKKVGILSFFSGSLETVCRGSYVLLKPSTASALMPDHQLSPSSKSQLNGIGGSSLSTPAAGATPHHLVGNGTSSVIAGLSRSDASAGIVSNVDIKNGFCEIILVDRDQVESKNLLGSSHLKLRRSMKSKSSAGGRHTLTVRALRVPLADTVHAQEFPLYLDTSVPFETLVGSMLNSSLDSILSAVSLKHRAKDEGARDVEKDIEPDSNFLSFDTEDLLTDNVDNAKSARLGVLSLAADLMTIRCCMVLLSDQRILSSVNGRKEIMSKLLELAWPNDSDAGANVNVIKAIRNKGLWSLPIHEATFGHLVALQRDLNFRMQIMKHSSNQQREGRMKDFRSLLEVVTRQCLKTGTSIAEAPSESISQIRTDSVGTAEASENAARRSVSHSTEGNNSDEEEENETSTTATNHLREAAIAQMAELGLPRSWSELALRKTGGTNIEAAVTFCLERGSEIERMLADEQESDRLDNNGSTESSSRGRRHRDNGSSSRLLRQLLEMGFPKRWCAEALAVTGNDVDVALTWILSNGERLSEEDEALDAGDGVDGENSVPLNNADDEDEDDEDDDDDTENGDSRSTGNIDASKDTESMNIEANLDSVSKDVAASWNGSIIPLRFISGRAIVDPVRMEISGLSAGGFSSVGTKGVLLTSGKWYYEAVLETAGCLQIGWADGSFAGHCHADRGDGCGDGPSSWAFDGWRRYRWHATATEWGCRWKQGDVVGCLVDMDERVVAFTLNGQAENIGMGVAFTSEGFRPCGGVYACVSFNRKEKLRFILGGNGCEPFKYPPPISYRGVGEAVLEAVQERDHLLSKENVLDDGPVNGGIDENTKSFLCDFSDGDHGHELMAWAHRYYGSDASVHLGSSRPKSGLTKPSVVSSVDFKASSLVTRRLMKVWTDLAKSDPVLQQSDFDSLSARVFVGYEKVQNRLTFEIFNECLAIGVLLSRKLLLHVLITEGKKFDPTYFDIEGKNRLHGAKKFWNIVETCTSLRRAGWVGEAGAMAIAAEAVGLGISSNEQLRTKTTGHRLGVVSVSDIDEGIYLPTCGYTQVLSSVIKQKLDSGLADTTFLPTSCAEAALGSDGGSGLLAFLQDGLSSLVCGSTEIREVLIASTRRAVRHISTVEYDCDDFDASDTSKVMNLLRKCTC